MNKILWGLLLLQAIPVFANGYNEVQLTKRGGYHESTWDTDCEETSSTQFTTDCEETESTSLPSSTHYKPITPSANLTSTIYTITSTVSSCSNCSPITTSFVTTCTPPESTTISTYKITITTTVKTCHTCPAQTSTFVTTSTASTFPTVIIPSFTTSQSKPPAGPSFTFTNHTTPTTLTTVETPCTTGTNPGSATGTTDGVPGTVTETVISCDETHCTTIESIETPTGTAETQTNPTTGSGTGVETQTSPILGSGTGTTYLEHTSGGGLNSETTGFPQTLTPEISTSPIPTVESGGSNRVEQMHYIQLLLISIFSVLFI